MKKPIYQDKNGNWFIHTKRKGHNITIRGYNSYKEAEKDFDYAIDKWLKDHNYLSLDNTTAFTKIANDYVEYTRNGKASRTADREKTQINTYWGIIFQNDTIKSIYDFMRLKVLYQNLKDDETLNVRKKHDLVYTFLAFTNYCYIQKLINKEAFEETNVIFQPIKYAKVVEQERRIIPNCDLKAFLDAIPSESKDKALFITLINCGVRISELLGLCLDCVDLDKKKIAIKRQLLVNGELSNKLKTQQSYRTIPMSNELCETLTKYIKQYKIKNRLFKYSHTNAKRILKMYEDKANIPNYVFHEFRHTFCYEKAKLCENISDVVYVAKISGHSTSIFLNTYCSHLDNSLEQKFFQ